MADFPQQIHGHAYVYVMAALNDEGYCAPVKVGFSKNPEKRVGSVATACPFPICLYFSVLLPEDLAKYTERAFHEVKSEDRLHNEWFNIPPYVASQLVCLSISAAMHVSGCDTDDIFARIDETIWSVEPILLLRPTHLMEVAGHG